MAWNPDDFALLLPLGFLVGAYGTLVGAGGGFVLVPVLLLLYPASKPAAITAMSLTVVFFNAYAGTWAYARMGRIDYAAGLLFALAGIPGALLGALIVTAIPRGPFDVAFGLLLFALGGWLILQPMRSVLQDGRPHDMNEDRQALIGAIGSAYLGLLSSLLGIGGGTLHVPFLVRVLHFPPHIATATSQFVLVLVTAAAMLLHVLRGELNDVLATTAYLALGVMLGAPVGAALSQWLRGPLLIRLLAFALIIVAARLLWRFVS